MRIRQMNAPWGRTRMLLTIFCLSLVCPACAVAAPQGGSAGSVVFEDLFSTPDRPKAWQADWEALLNGPVEATIDVVPAAGGEGGELLISADNNAEGGVWLGLQSRVPVPVDEGRLIEIAYEAELTNTVNCFVSLNFAPAGGETRIYFAEGGAPRQVYRRSIEVPPGAETVRVQIASDGPTESMRIDWVRLSVLDRGKVEAVWEPRPGATAFPRSEKPPSPVLQVLDVTEMDWEEASLAAILQGMVNETEPEVYLHNYRFDPFWLDWLIERGYVREVREHPDLASLVDHYRDRIKGAVVYDRAVPGSIHAAAMIAALRGELACSPELAEAHGIPVTMDLRGRWERNIDAYRYVFDNHWDEMNHHVLAVHFPMMEHPSSRDYFYDHKVFTFWVSDYRDDLEGKAVEEEWEFLREIMAATPPNIPVMGWFSYRERAGLMEFNALRLCSSYGKYLSVSEFCSNLTVHSGIEVDPAVFRQTKMRAKPPVVVDPEKLYLSLSVIDSGDAQWYWQDYQLQIWRDENRGSVPTGWSLNPTVHDIMPAVLEWYYRNATANDAFFCAMSGTGYFLPYQWGSRLKAADREKAWQAQLDDLGRYCDMLDLDMLTMHMGGWGEPSGVRLDVYERYLEALPGLTGLLPDFGRHNNTRPGSAIVEVAGRPVFHTLMRWITWDHLSTPLDEQSGTAHVDPHVEHTAREAVRWAPKARPGAMSGLILSWTMNPTRVMQVRERLPEDFEVVLPTQLPGIHRQIEALEEAGTPAGD